MAVGLGGVTERDLGGRHVTMDVRSEVAPSGRSDKIDAWIPVLKMSSRNMEATTSNSLRWLALRVY
jgi:hypothetical protein